MSYSPPPEDEQPHEAEVSAQKDLVLKQLLSPQARSRLGNIKLVRPELATLVENYLINLVSQGKINSQISDDQLKQILQSIQQPKREFKINRR